MKRYLFNTGSYGDEIQAIEGRSRTIGLKISPLAPRWTKWLFRLSAAHNRNREKIINSSDLVIRSVRIHFNQLGYEIIDVSIFIWESSFNKNESRKIREFVLIPELAFKITNDIGNLTIVRSLTKHKEMLR